MTALAFSLFYITLCLALLALFGVALHRYRNAFKWQRRNEIRSLSEYSEAIAKRHLLWDSKQGTPERETFEALGRMIDVFDRAYRPNEQPVTVKVAYCNGIEGRGWYVWEDEYQDEGFVHFSLERPTAEQLKAICPEYVEA